MKTDVKIVPRTENNIELADFIDEKELLKRLPISRRTAFEWEKTGKIPVVKIGRRKIYHWKSVAQALLRIQRGPALNS